MRYISKAVDRRVYRFLITHANQQVVNLWSAQGKNVAMDAGALLIQEIDDPQADYRETVELIELAVLMGLAFK